MEKEEKCRHENKKDKGTYYKCLDCEKLIVNLEGCFKYAAGYNMTPKQLAENLEKQFNG